MLRPLDARCRWVQFSRPLTGADYRALAHWLEQYPAVILRSYGEGTGTDLGFLRFFPNLRRFQADYSYDRLVSLEGLNHLPNDLVYLGLGQTRKRLSLAPLVRFTVLGRLYLEGQTEDVDVIGQLRSLTSLTMRSLALLPQVGTLQYLELWMIRGLADLSPVADIATLEYLFLQSLKQVTALPSLANCTRLTRVHLETMKGLTDLSPLRTAPALTQLALVDMRHLQPAHVAVLSGHPTLRHLTAGLGSRRKNDEVGRLLPLPPVSDYERHVALDAID